MAFCSDRRWECNSSSDAFPPQNFFPPRKEPESRLALRPRGSSNDERILEAMDDTEFMEPRESDRPRCVENFPSLGGGGGGTSGIV